MTADASITVSLRSLAGEFVVCRLPGDAPAPPMPIEASLYAVTRTAEELSIVCPVAGAPSDARVESGWRALAVIGPLDFALTGILSAIAQPLAAAGIAIFAISTYDTDHVLVRDSAFTAAIEALRAAGHDVAL